MRIKQFCGWTPKVIRCTRIGMLWKAQKQGKHENAQEGYYGTVREKKDEKTSLHLLYTFADVG